MHHGHVHAGLHHGHDHGPWARGQPRAPDRRPGDQPGAGRGGRRGHRGVPLDRASGRRRPCPVGRRGDRAGDVRRRDGRAARQGPAHLRLLPHGDPRRARERPRARGRGGGRVRRGRDAAVEPVRRARPRRADSRRGGTGGQRGRHGGAGGRRPRGHQPRGGAAPLGRRRSRLARRGHLRRSRAGLRLGPGRPDHRHAHRRPHPARLLAADQGARRRPDGGRAGGARRAGDRHRDGLRGRRARGARPARLDGHLRLPRPRGTRAHRPCPRRRRGPALARADARRALPNRAHHAAGDGRAPARARGPTGRVD